MVMLLPLSSAEDGKFGRDVSRAGSGSGVKVDTYVTAELFCKLMNK